jgi:hypothetical protein
VNKETILMRKIMVALSEAGHFVMRTNAGTFFDSQGSRVTIGFPGLSDLTGCTSSGQFFAIEVKLPGEQPRQDQARFLLSMRSMGAIAGCAHSVEEALEIVNKGGI